MNQALADQLNNLDTAEVSLGAISVLIGIQDLHPTIQVASLITLTGVLLEVFGLDIRSEIVRLEHLVSDAETNGWDKKFAAVRAYIEGELQSRLVK